MQGKQEYLRMVKANDYWKNKFTGYYRAEPIMETKSKPKMEGHNQKKEKKTAKKETKPTMTKLERKQKHDELKRTLNKEWSIEMETNNTDSKVLNAPSHFKCYTMEESKVILQNPKREPQELGESYDGPKNSKQTNLARENEERR